MNDQQGHEDSEMSDKDLTMEEEYPQDLEKKTSKFQEMWREGKYRRIYKRYKTAKFPGDIRIYLHSLSHISDEREYKNSS